jgi:hypothetical protein
MVDSDQESEDSEVSDNSSLDQIEALTFPTGYADLEKEATRQYQIALRNDEFRRFRTVEIERDQLQAALVRVHAMNLESESTMMEQQEVLSNYTEERILARRKAMQESEVLPNTMFVGLKPNHSNFVIEDGLGEFSYIIKSFETELEQITYFNDVLRRHASIYPIPPEGSGNYKLHHVNTNVVVLSPTEYANIMKQCYNMSDHRSTDSTARANKDSNTWWSGNINGGTKYWSVSDWMSMCSCLAHILPVMAMSMLFNGNERLLNSSCNRNTAYRKCIEFMIWCYSVGCNNEEDNEMKKEKILMTIDMPMYVILDSGSTAHMVRDIGLLTNVRKMPKPVSIGGVEHGGQGIVCKHWGNLLSVKRVMYSDKSSANILSLSALQDGGHSVNFDNEKDGFVVKFLGSNRSYLFTRGKHNGAKSKHYGCNLNVKNESVCVGTVSDNLKQYTVAEIEKARAAREQGDMLGFISTDAHCNMIKSGDIHNNTVTIADVYRALKIWGPSIPKMMGKTKLSAPPRAVMDTVYPVEHKMQVMEIDIFFVQEIPFLMAVLTPMGYCMSAELKNRSAMHIKGVLMSMISACRANNIDITAVSRREYRNFE